MVSILLRNGPSNVLFFGFRTKVKDYLPDTGQSWWGNFVTDFVSGAFLGAFISTVMYPINVIKAHQQCQVSAGQCRGMKKCRNFDSNIEQVISLLYTYPPYCTHTHITSTGWRTIPVHASHLLGCIQITWKPP